MQGLRESTDVMVRLDSVRLLGLCAGGLNDIRIDRALGQPPGIGQSSRFALKYFHEFASDDLAFLFRIADAFERRHELLRGIHGDYSDAEVAGKSFHDLDSLVKPQEPSIDENAGQLRSDGPMN